MTRYKEILHLHSQGISQRSIAVSCKCSRNTVVRTIKDAEMRNISFPLPEGLTDEILYTMLHPKEDITDTKRRKPDYEFIHHELVKKNVTLSSLWREYFEECIAAGDIPFKYTQFCVHYREFVKNKNEIMLTKQHKKKKIKQAEEIKQGTNRKTGGKGGFNVILHYPKTEEKKRELVRRIAEFNGDIISKRIINLDCSDAKKSAIFEAVIKCLEKRISNS